MNHNKDDYLEPEPGVWVPKETTPNLEQLTAERDAAYALFREKSDALLWAQQLTHDLRQAPTPEAKLLEHHNL